MVDAQTEEEVGIPQVGEASLDAPWGVVACQEPALGAVVG